MTYLIIFLIMTICSVAYLKLAIKFNIIDKPNQRSSHTIPTIRGGGVLFFISILLFFITSKGQYPYFFIGTFIIAFVSFIDDLKTLSSRFRLPFQFLAISLILFQIYGFTIPFWIFIPLMILGVGFINLYNFMDGINGITGIFSLVILSALYMVNRDIKVINNDLFIYQVIAIIVFGFYNFRKKARFFAGDIGSISLAMMVFFTGLFMIYEQNSPIFLMFMIVYGADSTLTVFYRLFVIKENIGEPHRHHIYQKLVDRTSLSHIQVSLLYALVQSIVSLIIFQFCHLEFVNQLIVMGLITVVFISLYIGVFVFLEKKKIN
ncbi:MraY family glycosyltransferase [Wenyingzhuangia sp. IMCC45533]